jgi:very-short-patch-repair endonuclease
MAQTGWSFRRPACSAHVVSKRKCGIYNVTGTEERRKELRNNSTVAETVLWKYLKDRQLEGKKFRRQSSVGPYIVDFYCPEKRVVVELDGARHYGPAAGDYDDRRTRYLKERGIKVFRFENRTLYRDLEGVLEEIRKALREDDS